MNYIEVCFYVADNVGQPCRDSKRGPPCPFVVGIAFLLHMMRTADTSPPSYYHLVAHYFQPLTLSDDTWYTSSMFSNGALD